MISAPFDLYGKNLQKNVFFKNFILQVNIILQCFQKELAPGRVLAGIRCEKPVFKAVFFLAVFKN